MRLKTAGLLSVGLMAIWAVMAGCTNSKPLRAEESAPIYCSIDSLYFIYTSQDIHFYMKYTGGSSPLAWHVSSKPGWLVLQPSSGYLTYEMQYLNASLDPNQLYYMDYGTYRGVLVIATGEGNKNIPAVLKYVETSTKSPGTE